MSNLYGIVGSEVNVVGSDLFDLANFVEPYRCVGLHITAQKSWLTKDPKHVGVFNCLLKH